MSYVVHLVGSDDPKPFKHFGARVDAATYANERAGSGEVDRADIYLVPDAKDAVAAVAAVQMGAAKLVESRSPRASEAEIEAAHMREWESAVKLGPHAVLKFLGLPKRHSNS
jgi:hypothetical protein